MQGASRRAVVVLTLVAAAAAMWSVSMWARGLNTVFSGTVSAHSDASGDQEINIWVPFAAGGLLPGTPAYVAIVGYKLVFDDNTDSDLDAIRIEQATQSPAGGYGNWSAGSYVADPYGLVRGLFFVQFTDNCPILACHPFTCTVDYIVLGESGQPSLAGYTKWYPNYIGTGEARGSSSGGAAVATVSGTGFEGGSSVFVALTGWHFVFRGNEDYPIHEIGMSTQDEVNGRWEYRNEFRVRDDGSFRGRYVVVFDCDADDDAYDLVINYVVIGMVAPTYARYKSNVFPKALATVMGWQQGRGSGNAYFTGTSFYGATTVYPILSGFGFNFSGEYSIHEVRISPMKAVLGGYEFSSELPVDSAGRVQGRYFLAFNDDGDDEDFSFLVDYLLLGYGP
jgi:hypothetical protein